MSALLDATDRRVVVTGAANGIGRAIAECFVAAGARVVGVDRAPIEAAVAERHAVDCGDPAALDQLVESLGAVDVLVNSVGLPNGDRFGPGEVMAVNWLGVRHLTEGVLPSMAPGSAVVHVASTAGRRWPENRAVLDRLWEAADFEAGAAWVAEHPDIVGDGYGLSKQIVRYYTTRRALETLPRSGVRMNAINPGVTNTQLAPAFRRGVGDAVIDGALAITGRAAEPAEMAPAALFLACEATASYLNGTNLDIDRGTGAAALLADSAPDPRR